MSTDGSGTFVRVNRLKYGWTSNVQVAADDNSLGALAVAKEKALEVIRELEAELNPVAVEAATEDELPY